MIIAVMFGGLLAAALPELQAAGGPPAPAVAPTATASPAPAAPAARRCLKRSALGRCERWSALSKRPLAAPANTPRPPSTAVTGKAG